jgi:6-phosphofructokinase
MAVKRIGMLTGGGDVPGLNAVIKSATYRSSENNIEIIGLRRGWEALTHLNVDDPASRAHYVIQLTRENTRTIDRHGGTVLHTSRTNPAKIRNLPTHLDGKNFPASASKDGVATKTWDLSTQVVTNLSALGIEHLIAIGGDDTLSYAAKLHQLGVKIIAIPKTMDNDVRNTEYCIGFSTAITRASDAIQRQRTTVGSHERIGVFRVFGRDTGFTALYAAYATSIRCVIPEYKVDLEKLIQLLLDDKRTNPSNYALVCSARAPRGTAMRCRSAASRTHTDTARRRAWPRCSLTRLEGELARRRSPPISPMICGRAIQTLPISWWH